MTNMTKTQMELMTNMTYTELADTIDYPKPRRGHVSNANPRSSTPNRNHKQSSWYSLTVTARTPVTMPTLDKIIAIQSHRDAINAWENEGGSV